MRILGVTGNRADYDLMSYLYKKLNIDAGIEFGLVVTGGHLRQGYENSVAQIRSDSNNIVAEIPNIKGTDKKRSQVDAMAALMERLPDAVEAFNPDVIIVAGDREEVNVVALTAAYMRIPLLHFFGGDFEASGHPDNLARSVGSKLATAHFVTIEEHRQRLLALGEEDRRIFCIGSVALDKFKEEPFLDRASLFKRFGLGQEREYALLIYHPPVEIEGENREIQNILEALESEGVFAFVSYPNTDYGSLSIATVYDHLKDKDNFCFYRNLERNLFINLFRNASFQIGNSSSGIAEAASVPLPVINVGSRQTSRKAQENVIFIDGGLGNIKDTIRKVRSRAFRDSIRNIQNMYGDGKASSRAYDIIKATDFQAMLLKTYDPLDGRRRENP